MVSRPDRELSHARDVIFLDALPRNWHGEIDRRLHDLVKSAAVQRLGSTSHHGPSEPTITP